MLYYTPGNAIVTEEEFSAGPIQEQLGQFYGALQEQRTPEPVQQQKQLTLWPVRTLRTKYGIFPME